MAVSDISSNQITIQQGEEEKLKRLEFIHTASLQALDCATKVYDIAKDKSGPLKTGVEAVEGTLKSVVVPVYDKYHDVPYQVLKFADGKVDVTLKGVDNRIPSVVKDASSKAYNAAQKAPTMARSLSNEVKQSGITGIAKSAYSKVEPVAEQYAVSTWHTLNKFPVVPSVTNVVVPTAAYGAEKYNSVVGYCTEKGYTFSNYLPVVPTEKIAKVFAEKKEEETKEGEEEETYIG